MQKKARFYAIVASFTLAAAVTTGPVTMAGWGANAQELDWATSAGSSILDSGNDIAADSRGNSYVTGGFRGSPFGTSGFDTFVAKYASNGTLLWFNTTSGGSSDIDSGQGIAIDPRGNSYVTGRFTGIVTFGADEANETTLESEGGAFGAFVAKYAQDGSLLWATSAGVFGNDIATDSRGNSYVTGGAGGVFMAKFSPDGSLLWTTSASGSVSGIGIALSGGDDVFVTGLFQGTVTFGPGEANETVLTAAGEGGGRDVFVAKYAPDGSLLWAKSAGGPSGFNDVGSAIATDPRGNSHVTGRFVETATFGAGEANETTLESAGGDEVFVAKYAPDGTFLWATSAGGVDGDSGEGIAVDPRGNSYVTGGFRVEATFGAGEANETVLNALGELDVFVAKYRP